MYLNEKAWEVEPEDLYEASDALKNFLDVYKVLAGRYGRPEVYVPSEDEPYFRSVTYSIAKWLMLDEPTSALDPELAKALTRRVVQYCRRHSIALILISHNDSFEQYYREMKMEVKIVCV